MASSVGMPLAAPTTAAALIIGNELLSGKVEEENLVVLARALRGAGVALRRVVWVEDRLNEVADEMAALSRSFDWLFTSGGIGPTHDDVTIDAAARAFNVPVVTSAILEERVRRHYGARCTDGHLRLARIPEGAALESSVEVPWPTLRIRNTWLMPGVPAAFRMKISVVLSRIGQGAPFVSSAVYTQLEEGELLPLLEKIVAQFPEVEVGSYPKWGDARYKTKLTFDGRNSEIVVAARDAFVALFPKGEPVSIE